MRVADDDAVDAGRRYVCTRQQGQGAAAASRAASFKSTKEKKAVRHAGTIVALLLDCSTLLERSRKEFLTMMNEFLLMPPSRNRRAIRKWMDRAPGDAH
ncbi:hypothetical protein WS63_00855 [Burkholderia stagnalis]|nr:hypothetical protein WS63_00855 [Burkholderia stagnalis]